MPITGKTVLLEKLASEVTADDLIQSFNNTRMRYYDDAYSMTDDELREVINKIIAKKSTFIGDLFTDNTGEVKHTIEFPAMTDEMLSIYYDALLGFFKSLAKDRLTERLKSFQYDYGRANVIISSESLKGIAQPLLGRYLDSKALEFDAAIKSVDELTVQQLKNNESETLMTVFGTKYQKGTKITKILSRLGIDDSTIIANRMLIPEQYNERIYMSYHPAFMVGGGRISNSCYSPDHHNEHSTWGNLMYDHVAIVFNETFTQRFWILIDQENKLFHMARMYPTTNPATQTRVIDFFASKGYTYAKDYNVSDDYNMYSDFSSDKLINTLAEHYKLVEKDDDKVLRVTQVDALTELVTEVDIKLYSCDGCGDRMIYKGDDYCSECLERQDEEEDN